MFLALILAALPQGFQLAAVGGSPEIAGNSVVCGDDAGHAWIIGQTAHPAQNEPALVAQGLDIDTLQPIPGTLWHSEVDPYIIASEPQIASTRDGNVLAVYKACNDALGLVSLAVFGVPTGETQGTNGQWMVADHPQVGHRGATGLVVAFGIETGECMVDGAIVPYQPAVPFCCWTPVAGCPNGRVVSAFGWQTANGTYLSWLAPTRASSLDTDSRGLVVGIIDGQPNGFATVQAWAQNGHTLGPPQDTQGFVPPTLGRLVALAERGGGVVTYRSQQGPPMAQCVNQRGRFVGAPFGVLGYSPWVSRDGHTLLVCDGAVVARYER